MKYHAVVDEPVNKQMTFVRFLTIVMSSNAYKALIPNSNMPHLDWALGEEADRRGLLARNA